MDLRFQKRTWPKSHTVFLETTHPKMPKSSPPRVTVKQVISTLMDVSSNYFSKNLLTNDILLAWGSKRSPKFVRYFEILFVEAVQLNAFLFAFGGKFELKKTQSIRLRYMKDDKFVIFHSVGEQICAPKKIFVRFENSWEIRSSLKQHQQHRFNSIKSAYVEGPCGVTPLHKRRAKKY